MSSRNISRSRDILNHPGTGAGKGDANRTSNDEAFRQRYPEQSKEPNKGFVRIRPGRIRKTYGQPANAAVFIDDYRLPKDPTHFNPLAHEQSK